MRTVACEELEGCKKNEGMLLKCGGKWELTAKNGENYAICSVVAF